MSSSLRPSLTGQARAEQARLRRIRASDLAQDAYSRPAYEAVDNGDNANFDTHPLAFLKGLEHDAFGVLRTPSDYSDFETALTQPGKKSETDNDFSVNGTKKSKFSDFKTTLHGANPGARTWESPLSGTSYVEEGPDPAAIAMPPAPRLGSSELCAEMAEVYAMALVRDMSLDDLKDPAQVLYFKDDQGNQTNYVHNKNAVTVQDLLDALNSFNWFAPDGRPFGGTEDKLSTDLSAPEKDRRLRGQASPEQTGATLFRGSAFGASDGDYLSKFLTEEFVSYGAQTIDQKIDPVCEGLDFMTSWSAWLDVQNGIALSGIDLETGPKRVLKTGRDLSRYVQVDALYQAYHVAALMMLGAKNMGTSSGFPEPNSNDTRDAFATFGGPHVLALFAEVSSRALKAVRRQKFQIHRRGRPERLAALFTLSANKQGAKLGSAEKVVGDMLAEMERNFSPFLDLLSARNTAQNSGAWDAIRKAKTGLETQPVDFDHALDKNYLLPMAFPEGSPMHPSYGAGHATVAGACVTVLKAFFDVAQEDSWNRTTFDAVSGNVADSHLTVEGELNKLAANISIGRDFAGVHYYSDYYESLRLGERVAVGILHEQMLNYNEPVSMHFHSFDGDRIRIVTDGGKDPFIIVNDANGKHIPTAEWWLRHTGAPMPRTKFLGY